jgi:hypothetical protein
MDFRNKLECLLLYDKFITFVTNDACIVILSCGLYYKHTTIVNDDSRVIRMTLQVVASPTIVILMTLEAPMVIILMTLESTGITYNCHLQSSKYFYITGYRRHYNITLDVIAI